MRRRAVARCAAVLSLLATGAVAGGAAATETVGRTSFELPSPAWQLVVDERQSLRYGDGLDVPLHTRIYQLAAASGPPKALLMISSTSGSRAGRTTWMSDTCPPARPRFFTADYSSNRTAHHRECVVVNSGFVAASYFRPMKSIVKALADQGIELPKTAVSMRSMVGTESGFLLRVNLITDAGFAGVPGWEVAASDLHDVPPALVGTGEALHDAVKASSRRVSGWLELPPLQFER